MKEIIASYVRTNKLAESGYRQLLARIEEAVRTRMTPAVSIAVFHKDAVVLESAWGWVDPDSKQFPTHTATMFDLASVSKLFTAVTFFTLLMEGKVTLNTPLVEVIPEFGESGPRGIDGGQDPHTKEHLPVAEALAGKTVDPTKVTFFHLLTHTSGLAPWRDVYLVADAPVEPPLSDPIGRSERWSRAVRQLCQYPFVGLPDDGVIRYSDIGMLLLGEAISRLHGSPGELDTAIHERILKGRFSQITHNPLYNDYQRHQITPTEFDKTWRKRRIWGEVHDENACGIGGVAGHAGLFAPAIEVALFGNLWLNHVESAFDIDHDLAGAATELQAQTGSEVRGLAWMLKSHTDSSAGERFHNTSYGHTGFTGTSLWIDPQANLVVALLTNRVWPGRDVPGIHELRRDVHDIIHEGLVR